MSNYLQLKDSFSKERLLKLINDGYTYSDLQAKYSFNQRLFSRLAKEYNIPKNYKNISKNSNQWHKVNFNQSHVVHLYYNLNYSLRKIATIYNCTHSAVSKYFSDNNMSIRSGSSKIYYESRRVKYRKHELLDSNGYVLLTINGEMIREHRYVMGNYIGRELDENEYVHHIDFDKTNNDIDNLFLFDSDSLHQLYHGYIGKHIYISPEEYLVYYETNLKNTFDNYNWMHKHYIGNMYSCNEISKILDVSRHMIVNKMKQFGIYDLRPPTINQYN